jgi:type IX secretion system substrate protein
MIPLNTNGMKRNLLIVLFLLSLSQIAIGQSFDWVRFNKVTGCYGKSVCVDKSGNIYSTILYNLYGSVIIDTTIYLPTYGGGNSLQTYLLKTDSLGNVLFVKQCLGYGGNVVTSLTCDTNNNILLTGNIPSLAYIDSLQFNSGGCFISKYDSTGNLLFVKKLKGNVQATGLKIKCDALNNIYISGYFKNKLIIGVDTIYSTGKKDGFLIKYTSQGNPLWVKSFGGKDDDELSSLAIDRENNVICSGTFTDTAYIDTMQFISKGSKDIIIFKLNSAGQFNWIKKEGDANEEEIASISIDNSDNIIACGSFKGFTIISNDSINSNAASILYDDGFLAKYDSSGNKVWVNHLEGNCTFKLLHEIVTDTISNISYFIGSFAGCIIMNGDTFCNNFGTDFDILYGGVDASGNYTLGIQAGMAPEYHDGEGLALDYFGNLYSSGTIGGITTFLNLTTGNTNSNVTFFVAKLNLNNTPSLINENNEQSSFFLYPNPTNSILNLFTNIKENITITNILGEIVLQKTAEGKVGLDVSFLSSGIYFIKAGNEVRKFVKE